MASGQWPKTSPNGSPAVQGEQWGRSLWGERSRGLEGRQDPPRIVRGNLPPPGWDAVCTRQVIPLSSFIGSRLGSVLQVPLICAYSTCHMLVIRQYALIFNKYLFGLKSKSLSWKVHSKRYFWNAKRACPLSLHLDEMHQMGHCHFCQFWQSFDIYQRVFLRKIFIWFFLFKILFQNNHQNGNAVGDCRLSGYTM